MMINKTELKLLADALRTMESGYSELPDFAPELDEAALSVVLDEVAKRMQDICRFRLFVLEKQELIVRTLSFDAH